MKKVYRMSDYFIVSLIGLSFLLAIYSYPFMPDIMASHWDIQGKINGYLPKTVGLFLLPAILCILYLLFIIIPKIDPKRKNNSEPEINMAGVKIVIFLFLFFIYLLTLLLNSGWHFNIVSPLSLAFAILFYYLGILLPKVKPNWFLGIKTPWTLSDDLVWKKTHETAGIIFKFSGLSALFGFIFPAAGFYLVLIPVICGTVFLFGYSYWEYRSVNK